MRSIVVMCRLALMRSVAAPGLMAIRFSGVIVAVILVSGVMLYSSAMGDAMLQASLRANQGTSNVVTSVTGTSMSAALYASLDRYVRQQEAHDLGLPLTGLTVHHNTSTMAVYHNDAFARTSTSSQSTSSQSSSNASTAAGPPTPLAYLTLDYYAGLRDRVRVVAGALDETLAVSSGAVAVVVSQYTAQSLHLHVGDRLAYSADGHSRLGPALQVTAVFVPRNINSSFWGIHAGVADDRSLIMPQVADFVAITTRSSLFSPTFIWAVTTDVSAVHYADAQTILARVHRVSTLVGTIIPGAVLITSIDMGITGFINQYDLLPVILLILVTPIVALVLYAIGVTTALALDRQAGEIVLLSSRGATVVQVSIIYLIEGLILGGVALLIGPPLGLGLGTLIGHASGFLRFGGGLPYSLHLSGSIYLLAAATALLGLLVGLLPALGLTRRSMTNFKQEQGRASRRPLWQRLFLDVVVLAFALYSLSVLTRQGAIASGVGTAAIAQDPLIGISPLLFAIAVTLLLSRALPWVATLGVRIFAHLSSPPAHVAMQSVARTPRQPMRLVHLCTLTLTMGVFAATVAQVESRNLSDQQLYQAGTQVRLMEYNAMIKQWQTMPLADHLALPGVQGATPVLRFESTGDTTNTTSDGTIVNLLGIDPATANGVIWYRPDFSGGTPFLQLLHSIAQASPGAIVSTSFIAATGLHIGDGFDITLANGHTVHLRVAATTHYFATLDPATAPFVIANLAYLQQASHSAGPSEVWLTTVANRETVDRLVTIARSWPRRILDVQGISPTFSAQDQPLTAGIYGVVSVGFLISLALALLGFVAYAYLSLQRRRTEFAIVRALGLSPRQLRWLLLFEQFYLLGAGIVGGIVAGVLTTVLFLPYLPFASNTLPPFLIATPWVAILEFIVVVIVVFLLVLSIHVSMLLRLQLGRVLRLGEA